MIPEKSVAQLYLLGRAILVESNEKEVYRTYNIIQHALNEASSLKCVLPFFYGDFNKYINDLIDEGSHIELIIPKNIKENFEYFLNLENDNVDLTAFNIENAFLLVVTDKVMILGLFKEDGNFDQNRIITSKKEECIKWGENLFENFKIRLINEYFYSFIIFFQIIFYFINSYSFLSFTVSVSYSYFIIF